MLEPAVLYEDDDFLAVDKPAGLVVHGSARREEGREDTLVDWILKNYPEVKTVGDDPVTRPGIVHRLDKDTSGVLLVARSQAYFEYLKNLFQTRDIEKTYLALVRGNVRQEQGTIDVPIGIKSGTTKRSVHSEKMRKEAVTEYRVLKRFEFGNPLNEYTLLEVIPKTGRTHQIRVHLASIGRPVVGDAMYGKSQRANRKALKRVPGDSRFAIRDMPKDRLMLHALSIEFTAALGKRLKIEAPMPDDFKNVLDELKAGSG